MAKRDPAVDAAVKYRHQSRRKGSFDQAVWQRSYHRLIRRYGQNQLEKMLRDAEERLLGTTPH